MKRFLRFTHNIPPLLRHSPHRNPSFLGQNLSVVNSSGRGDRGSERTTSQRNLSQIRSDNPYEVLGISNSATYAEAKTRFLELALKHHPDHASSDEAKPDDFIRFRKAFESLKETMDGKIIELEEGESSWTDEEFSAWYYEETGQSDFMFKIDMKTRREVIDVVKNAQAQQGGLDRGGIWEMARRMAEEEAILKENKNKIKRTVGLDAGSKSDSKSSLRRRRKKR